MCCHFATQLRNFAQNGSCMVDQSTSWLCLAHSSVAIYPGNFVRVRTSWRTSAPLVPRGFSPPISWKFCQSVVQRSGTKKRTAWFDPHLCTTRATGGSLAFRSFNLQIRALAGALKQINYPILDMRFFNADQHEYLMPDERAFFEACPYMLLSSLEPLIMERRVVCAYAHSFSFYFVSGVIRGSGCGGGGSGAAGNLLVNPTGFESWKH